MFDKFIESGSESDQNSRRNYFLVSTVIVGVLFVTGVIASIYAQEVGLGTDEFELSSMLAPIVPEEVPEPPRPEQQQQQSRRTASEVPIRQAAIDRVSSPTVIPDTTSVVQNTQREIPLGRFEIRFDLPESDGGNASGVIPGTGQGTSARSTESEAVEPKVPEEVPPPVIKKVPPIISKGPMNGYAIELPKPPYPKPAQIIGVAGNVVVQVLIDEKGNVVSAKAVSGHPLLRLESERAARRAKFHPTTLGDVPVKVTGVITYKFSK